MQKSITLLLLLCTTLCFSQNVTLKGTVNDPDNLPIESATVYLTSVKDSTVINYTISDNNGNWEIQLRAKEEPIDLKVSFIGFADYKERLDKITEDRDFGTIQMSDKSTELNEVVIEGEVPPIRVKSDTLEFNASSFKVRPDSNVQALIKQLPGVEVDSDGKITVNGKEVNQVLVNGKPFFDENGQIALQNLPADIIDKVQVTDTKTKKEELTGEAASGDNASINLTIEEDKNKGFFGKFMGGYGTDDRYESSALVNYFKGDRKISLLASANNINSPGFTMNEIFDSMGGGRNTSVYTTSSGGFGINGMRFGGGNGITKSKILGINYADIWMENLDSNMSYFYTAADTENENRTTLITYLTGNEDGATTENSLVTESTSKTRTDQYSNNFNTEFEFKIDSTSTIFFDPELVVANSKNYNTSQQTTRNQDNLLLNESEGTTFNKNENKTFGGSLDYNKKFSKKGRYFNVYLQNNNRIDDGAAFNKTQTLFYDNSDAVPTVTSDNRDQVQFNRQTSDSYEAGLEYAEPITDSITLIAGLEYDIRRNVEDRDGFNFDAVTDGYTSRNDSLTNYLASNTHTLTPTLGIRIRRKKYSLSVSGGTANTRFRNDGSYRGVDYTVNNDYLLPELRANFNYRFSKSKSTYISYNYDVNFPQASQVLPIEDVSNALSTQTGNPNLEPNKGHRFYLSFRNFDYTTHSGFNAYGGGTIRNSQVVSRTDISSSAKRTTTFTNVSGTYQTWFGGYWSKSVKREGYKLRFNIGINGNLSLNKGFTNGELFKANDISISPRVNFTWEYGDILTVNPSYNFRYNQTNYTNYTINSASNTTHELSLRTTSYWPKHFVFGNDFGYNYNSNLGSGFRNDFYLWNTSIGYNFLNDKLLFKVKVYDVLNQNLGTSRTITATSVFDQENIVLKRYVMFSLTYKIQKFGAKKTEDNANRFWWF
ncbi:outer membrane beta-barrel protein [Flavobacterium litorale]|uniref:Outer membrane beta-barrel protein n=1 Tax=Flavobacterium litorale TaxID=2856519 RepID=A0ABX8V7L5_9FLAO|nr:outer membrane beta-barrel protein [Flavobacterium litorale]QYJ68492.1 outer membrane beta-barrel protein [Flavobacterium litorale]